MFCVEVRWAGRTFSTRVLVGFTLETPEGSLINLWFFRLDIVLRSSDLATGKKKRKCFLARSN